MASIQFTEADRDARGFVKAPSGEPRSLADLLPPIAPPADQTIHRSPPTVAELATIAVLGLLLIALVVYLAFVPARVPAVPATPPAAPPDRGDGTRGPSPLPAAPPAPPARAGRLLIAFAAPNGEPLGAIESTRAITPTAHYGDEWIQADVAGSGRIWLRASDAPDLPIVGPDLAPRRVAPQAVPAVVAPPPTPEPQPPCLTAGTGEQTVTVCDWMEPDQLRVAAARQWVATYGGNIGIVGTPSPQPIRRTP